MYIKIGLRFWVTYGSFFRFVRLFWLCDLAWKSSLLLFSKINWKIRISKVDISLNPDNKICSIDQIFFMTFQFCGSKIRFCYRFEQFYSFSISSSPIFTGWFWAKLILKGLNSVFQQHQIVIFGKPHIMYWY